MSEFVYHRSFAGVHAEQRIMRDPAPIPRANIRWYFTDDPKPSDSSQLLTREQEVTLFLQYNYARWRAARGEAPWAVVATQKRDMLVEYNLALVLSMVARHLGTNHRHHQDIVLECNTRLVRAVELFDISKGFKFSTYACHAIVNQSWRFAQRTGNKDLAEIPCDWSPTSDPVSEHRAEVEDDARAERSARVRAAMERACLTDQERDILAQRYLGSQKAILSDIGKKYGLSKERVRQIESIALKKVRTALDEMTRMRYSIHEGDFVHDRFQGPNRQGVLEVQPPTPDQSVRQGRDATGRGVRSVQGLQAHTEASQADQRSQSKRTRRKRAKR